MFFNKINLSAILLVHKRIINKDCTVKNNREVYNCYYLSFYSLFHRTKFYVKWNEFLIHDGRSRITYRKWLACNLETWWYCEQIRKHLKPFLDFTTKTFVRLCHYWHSHHVALQSVLTWRLVSAPNGAHQATFTWTREYTENSLYHNFEIFPPFTLKIHYECVCTVCVLSKYKRPKGN